MDENVPDESGSGRVKRTVRKLVTKILEAITSPVAPEKRVQEVYRMRGPSSDLGCATVSPKRIARIVPGSQCEIIKA